MADLGNIHSALPTRRAAIRALHAAAHERFDAAMAGYDAERRGKRDQYAMSVYCQEGVEALEEMRVLSIAFRDCPR